jgi:hypothetical protein
MVMCPDSQASDFSGAVMTKFGPALQSVEG